MFAAPGSPLDPRAEGTNDLLREGATICARVEDVLDGARADARARPVRRAARTARSTASRSGASSRCSASIRRRRRERRLAMNSTTVGPAYVGASTAWRRRATASSPCWGPRRSRSTISRAPRKPRAREVRVALMELELAGRIEYSGGDRVALRPSASEPA